MFHFTAFVSKVLLMSNPKAYPNIAGFINICLSHHEACFRKLLSNIKDGSVFKKDEVTSWKCCNCAYVHEGKEAPELCPACNLARAYFEVLAENY